MTTTKRDCPVCGKEIEFGESNGVITCPHCGKYSFKYINIEYKEEYKEKDIIEDTIKYKQKYCPFLKKNCKKDYLANKKCDEDCLEEFTKLIPETECNSCKWGNFYDDGDGYCDCWCDCPDVQWVDYGNWDLFPTYRDHCPCYKEN